MSLHDLAEKRSLAYHRAVARLLPTRPDLLETACARASAWSASDARSAPYAREWLEVLSRPLDEIVAAMLEDSERGRARRQATPFAGALDPRERWRLWREIRERWEAR